MRAEQETPNRHPDCLTAVVAGLLCCVALLAPPPAHGASASEKNAEKIAQRLISEGMDLRRAGKDADALPKFEEAYGLDPTPRAAAQWGLCLQAVGRWADADARIGEALEAKANRWIAKNRDVLKESLEQVKQHVARLEVHGGPEGAVVAINGRTVGSYPLKGPVPLNEGNVDIEVTKPGYKRGYRSLTIGGGQYQSVLIRLEEVEKLPTPLPTAGIPSATSNSAGGDSSLVASAESSGDDGSRPLYKRPWTWAVAGAVAAAAVVGVVLMSRDPSSPVPALDDEGVFK